MLDSQTTQLQRDQRKNIIILFFTLVIVMLGFGMVIPILPFYVESFGASGSTLGMLMAVYAVMQFLFAPVWGSLSDRVGRKPLLLLGVVGNGLAMLFLGLSTRVWMLFLSRALAGILSSATQPTAMAYIGDSTPEEERGQGMGMIGAAMGLGMVLGPGLGGWFGSESLTTPFYLAAGLSLLTAVLILIFLRESLPAESRTKNSGQIQGPDFIKMWRALYGPLGILLVMAFLLSFGMTNFESIFGIYSAEVFGYGTKQVGTVMVVIGVISAVMQGLLTGPATRKWGEVNVIRASLLTSAVGFVLMLFAHNYLFVILTTGFFIIGVAMLRPAVSSLTSRVAKEEEQGIALGLNNSFMSLGRIVGPAWAGFIFDFNHSFPYLSGALIMGVGFIVSLIKMKPAPRKEEG